MQLLTQLKQEEIGVQIWKVFHTEIPYGLKSKSIMMRGHGYKLLVIDYENNKIF